MPRLRNKRTKYPSDWDAVSETLEHLEQQLREAETESPDGKPVNESLWPIFRIHHQMSRYVFDMFFRKKAISRECYEFCIEFKFADAALIAKWKKPGYERLCCLRCIQPKDHNFGTTCVCRVPRRERDRHHLVECSHCGCTGCASGE